RRYLAGLAAAVAGHRLRGPGGRRRDPHDPEAGAPPPTGRHDRHPRTSARRPAQGPAVGQRSRRQPPGQPRGDAAGGAESGLRRQFIKIGIGTMRSAISTTALRAGIALTLAMLLASCVGSTAGPQRAALEIPIAGRAADRVPVAEPEPEPEPPSRNEPLILRGDDALFNPPRPLPAGVAAGDPVSLDFEQA